MDKIHVSIFGGCPTRDIFGICDQDNKYIIDRFVQEVNPISLVKNSPLLKPFDLGSLSDDDKKEIFGELSPFIQRCITIDLQKNNKYFLETNSDFLMLDFIALRFNLLRSLCDDEAYLTDLFWIEAGCGYRKHLEELGYLMSGFSIVDILDLPDSAFYSEIDKFLRDILSKYEEKQIILVDLQCVYWCIDRNKKVCYLGDAIQARIENQRIQRGFLYAAEKLTNAHIIRFPQDVVSYDGHKWGKLDLHYVDEFYEYGYKAMEIIVKNCGNRVQEQRELDLLEQQYSALLALRYGRYRGEFLSCFTRDKDDVSTEIDVLSSDVQSCLHTRKIPSNGIMTFHGSCLCVNSGGALVHSERIKCAVSAVWNKWECVSLFVVSVGKYISSVGYDGCVQWADNPYLFEIVRNDDMSCAIIKDGLFLSARIDGTISWMPDNKEWEHFFVEEIIPGFGINHGMSYISGNQNEIFDVFTFHHTQLVLDGNKLVHINRIDNVLPVVLKKVTPSAWIMFVLQEGGIRYIENVDERGIAVLSIYPCAWESVQNLDASISLHQNDRFLSAKIDGGISLEYWNWEWEHFSIKSI